MQISKTPLAGSDLQSGPKNKIISALRFQRGCYGLEFPFNFKIKIK
jgi:hypothetical protein